MKTLTLFGAALLATAATDLTPSFELDEVRTTTFSFDLSSSLSELEITMDGNPGPERELGVLDQTRALSGSFTDEVTAMEDGEVTAFSRRYMDLAEELSTQRTNRRGEDKSQAASHTSELEEALVVFALDDGEFVAGYSDEEPGDDDLLEGLVPLLPLDGLLAGEEVEEGDEWEVEPQLWWDLMHLGGDLALVGDDGEEGGIVMPDFLIGEENREVDGELTATLVGVEDGVATVELMIEVVVTEDKADYMRSFASERGNGGPQGRPVPEIVDLINEREYEGEGTFLWDIDGGYMTSLEVTFTMIETETQNLTVTRGERIMERGQIMTLEGEGTLSVSVEVLR